MAALFLAGEPCVAGEREAVLGYWASKGSVFSITESGGVLHGRIIALRKPRPDRKNPDPMLRERPLIGLQVLSDYVFRRGRWRGRVYDPGSGSVYRSHMRVDDDGNLRLRGYVGISLLGRTEVFVPAATCSERIVDMLRISGVDGICDHHDEAEV